MQFTAGMNRSDEEIAKKTSQRDLGEAVTDLAGMIGLDFVFEALCAFGRKLWYDPSERRRFEADRVTQG